MNNLPYPPLRDGNILQAATLILVREAHGRFEVYLTERPGRVDFPSLHVFPGGKVSEQDDELAQAFAAGQRLPLVPGFDATGADAQLGERYVLRYWIACLREAFEEVGILFARHRGALLSRSQQQALAPFRDPVARGELSLLAFCQEQSLELDLQALHYFSHWFTPPSAPRRFDTRFFLAVLPPQQQTEPHAWEVVADSWVTPAEALALANDEEWKMISPTLSTLESLAQQNSVDGLVTSVLAQEHLASTDSGRLAGEGLAEYGAAVSRTS